jgi:hypothetical protein
MKSIFVILLLMGCNSNQPKEKNVILKKYAKLIGASLKDRLIPVTNESIYKFGVSCAFISSLGDTVIPFGRFQVFETDTLVTFTFVNDYKNGVVGINRKGEILFDAFIYGDFQLDTYSEGMIRVMQNEKIGYADKTGKIIIKPKYKYAFPFIHGKAKVTYDCDVSMDDLGHSTVKSNTWFYIDRNGYKIKLR